MSLSSSSLSGYIYSQTVRQREEEEEDSDVMLYEHEEFDGYLGAKS